MAIENKKVVLIDPATAGLNGLYLESYINACPENIIPISNYHDPFKRKYKYFFKYSDLAVQHVFKLGFLRLPIRFFEMLTGLCRTFFKIIQIKPAAVVYCLSSNLFLELFLLILLRVLRYDVYIVCHDVIPFVGKNESLGIKSLKRNLFYMLANKLIVHNEGSIKELKEHFNINEDKIYYLPFPNCDLNKYKALVNKDINYEPTNIRRYLFIGHMRIEKGINILLQAWKKFSEDKEDVKLILAGNLVSDIDRSIIDTNPSIELHSEYLTDNKYFEMINSSDLVIFPYIRGTNSAVLSNVVSLSKLIIVSDINMFMKSGLVPENSYFHSEDSESLCMSLNNSYIMDSAEILRNQNILKHLKSSRDELFKDTLITLIEEI